MPKLSSREFNHNPGKAKQSAAQGAVVITDRGRPTHVLLTWADYRRLVQRQSRLAAALGMEEAEPIDFESPRHEAGFHRCPELED
ncbi:hypothetical protein MIT9_P0534 [Methylomarinovum caldicuralii]|uniref:Antitoxin n=1 Tax=Methylomarinovum caldicuralii TaxID=438856 RepID=A0AAU9CH96_9GAMM|nr:type II toxin-antitoxin system prevent-host-death family antitoxin [Methylomarinovum caldicuralii]BCX80956.1 hypothetical protein MIT9_P0534 [Methylomarinovum caldicuralii]